MSIFPFLGFILFVLVTIIVTASPQPSYCRKDRSSAIKIFACGWTVIFLALIAYQFDWSPEIALAGSVAL